MSKTLTANAITEKNKTSGAEPRTLLEITLADSTILKYSDQNLFVDTDFNTPWSGSQADKLYLQSGQFTSTLKTSEDVSGVDNNPTGISYDGTNTPWSGGGTNKLYLQSGQFTSTIKDSEDVSAVDNQVSGISYDETNTPWCGAEADKLYLQSGQFTSTIKDSEDVSGVDGIVIGISYDGTNSPWCGQSTNKLYLQSGQFTSTIKDSEDVSTVDNQVGGVSYDGTNSPWSGSQADKLYLQSGQFTSTIKDSEDVSTVDTLSTGIETNKISSRLNAATYTANVLQWPSTIRSQIIPGEEVVRTGEMSLALSNNPRIDANIRAGLTVNLSLWFDGLTYADRVPLFKGIIADSIEFDVYRLGFTVTDIGDKFNKMIGVPLDVATYANADPDDIGKIQPIIYGDVKASPCLAIVAGAVSTLLNDISAGAASIELSDASAFPASGTIIIGDEEDITYSGKSTNTLTGVANVSFDYPRATTVLEKIAQLEYMVANHPVKAITNPRILPYGQKLEDAVRIDTGDFTANVNDGGIATVDITNIANVKKKVEIAVTQQPNQPITTQPDQPITTQPDFTTTAVAYIERHATGIISSAFNNPTNAFDFNDSTYADRTLGPGGGNSSLVLGYASTSLGTISEVRIVVRSENPVSGTITVQTGWTGSSYGQSFAVGDTLATRKFVTNITTWSQISRALFNIQGANASTRLYEMYYEVDYTSVITRSVDSVSNLIDNAVSNRITDAEVGGNSVADTLGGSLIVDVEGHPDDGSGTYTGTPDALIEEPWDLIHHLLITYSNGVATADIDLAGSFADAAANLPASYKFAFGIHHKISLNQLLARLAQQTWCRFVWEAGIAKLNRIKDSGTSSKSLDTDNDSYLSKDNRHLVKARIKGLTEIFNDIEVKSYLNYTLGSWNDPDAYATSDETTDAGSISNYGTRQRSWLMFAIGDNSSMSTDIRDKLLLFYMVRRTEITFPSPLTNIELERGDVIDLSVSQLGISKRIYEVIETAYKPPVPINRSRPEISFKLLDLLSVVEDLSFTITSTISGSDWLESDIPWAGDGADKLYLQSGQFTSTLKTSEDVSAVDTTISGISWDGTNTPWCGSQANKLYLQSGQFTSTIKDSEDVSGVTSINGDISWDGANTPWCGSFGDDKLYLQSGQFTSTIKTSEDVSGVDNDPTGISWDSTNTPWCGDKLYLQSGQFTSTVKTSEDISAVDTLATGITYDGTNTLWCGNEADKLYLQSGQFTSTLKTSEAVGAVDNSVHGIETNNVFGRTKIYVENLSFTITSTISETDELTADTPWAGTNEDKLYLQSGRFTSTLKDSEDVSAVDNNVSGISWDGTNTPWSGSEADKLYLTSGQFTSTIKTSEDVSGVDTALTDISWDGTNTPWVGATDDKLYLTSGQFTSTIKTSEDVSAVDTDPAGISWDGTNTPWCGATDGKLYLTSGQFTSTLKDSEAVSGVDTLPVGITWDGTNTPWSGTTADKLYLQSGQFTSTLKTSEDVQSIDTAVIGIETNAIGSRI